MDYVVVIEKTGNGYGAYVPDLPGCIAAADTREETESPDPGGRLLPPGDAPRERRPHSGTPGQRRVRLRVTWKSTSQPRRR